LKLSTRESGKNDLEKLASGERCHQNDVNEFQQVAFNLVNVDATKPADIADSLQRLNRYGDGQILEGEAKFEWKAAGSLPELILAT